MPDPLESVGNIAGGIKKLPAWAWIAGIAGAGVLALLYSNRQSAATPAGTTGTVATNPPNTTTPVGGYCPSYPSPTCTPPDFVIYTNDANGCQEPVCASSLQHPPTTPGTSCSSVRQGRTCTYGQNCPGSTLRQIFGAWGEDVNCALEWNPTAVNRGLDGPLWTTPVPFVVLG